MPLAEYRKKRKFGRTPEPSGKRVRRATRKDPIFVVQKHDASRLHFDFRLEIDGTLASWAIPRGPSLNSGDKRLAVMTEDHPLEYAEFEGVIPEGQYGAGTVMVWDRGRYELCSHEAAGTQLERGELKFALHGVKLRGEFVLIHSGARSANPSRSQQWLLIKHRDDYVDHSWHVENEALCCSVLTGRTLAEIAQGRPGSKRNRGSVGQGVTAQGGS
jgi:bifunctional non-homologous end joining protein LigD